MKVECGICQYSGDLASAPLFLVITAPTLSGGWFGFATASSRLPRRRSAPTSDKAAAPHRR
jgi:hypothetical protein